MTDALFIRCFCRIYWLLLYAYPRPFRQRYGGEMQQLFRDRCRGLARRRGLGQMGRFALQSVADWATTAVREALTAVDWRATGLRALRGIWSAGRQPARRGFVVEWSMTILTFLFLTTTMVQAYVVPTGSMEGSLRVGDHLLVDRVAYAEPGPLGRYLLPYRDIQHGDIVVFLYPEDTREIYVKRVIGLPGDRIRLVDKQVIRNGRALVEPYTQHIDPRRDGYRDDFPAPAEFAVSPRGRDMLANHTTEGEVVVPKGSLFVMGDNRDNSSDSRYWGFVPREYVMGKPLLVYWSYDAPTADLQTWTVSHLIDLSRNFFSKTRWERTFLVPRSQTAAEKAGPQ